MQFRTSGLRSLAIMSVKPCARPECSHGAVEKQAQERTVLSNAVPFVSGCVSLLSHAHSVCSLCNAAITVTPATQSNAPLCDEQPSPRATTTSSTRVCKQFSSTTCNLHWTRDSSPTTMFCTCLWSVQGKPPTCNVRPGMHSREHARWRNIRSSSPARKAGGCFLALFTARLVAMMTRHMPSSAHWEARCWKRSAASATSHGSSTRERCRSHECAKSLFIRGRRPRTHLEKGHTDSSPLLRPHLIEYMCRAPPACAPLPSCSCLT